jgi:hypothetical protein
MDADTVFYDYSEAGVTIHVATDGTSGTGTPPDGATDTFTSVTGYGGGPCDDVIRGSEKADLLSGGDRGDDHIYGYGGDDQLIAGGSGVVEGGSGDDYLEIDSLFFVFVLDADLGGGDDTFVLGTYDYRPERQPEQSTRSTADIAHKTSRSGTQRFQSAPDPVGVRR